MRLLFCWALVLLTGVGVRAQASLHQEVMPYFPSYRPYRATNHRIQYMGRVERSDSRSVRFWAPGVVVRMQVLGACQIQLRDQVPNERTHNYIEIDVDRRWFYRVKLTAPTNTLLIRSGRHVELNGRKLTVSSEDSAAEVGGGPDGDEITLCKDTESGIGWLEITGVKADDLLRPVALPKRKIEFIGNSITAGTGMDESEIPCGKGEWYDQHNAWMSYGAQTARTLNAQWHLTAVAGIGLVHSCCDMGIVMPQVFDKMDGRDNTGSWDFSKYVPDVVMVCLGQNDGIQDSVLFCSAYVRFLGDIRNRYPGAQIVCLTSPMGNKALTDVQKRYLGGVVAAMRAGGDRRVSSYFFSRQFSHGCGGHPDLEEHGLIAQELTGYLRQLMGW